MVRGRMKLLACACVAFAAVGCGGGDSGAPDAGQSTLDVPSDASLVDGPSQDVPDVAPLDVVGDVADTTVEDTGIEDVADAADPGIEDVVDTVEPDVGPDVGPDVPPDIAPDVTPDVPPADTTEVVIPQELCTTHADCLDKDLCTKDLCAKAADQPAACTSMEASCDDGDPCTKDSCDPAAGCINAFAAGDGCVAATVLFEARFDDGTTSGLTVEDLAKNLPEGQSPVLWVPDPSLTFSGAGALYFGIPGKYTFDNGKTVAASARTPDIALPAGKQAGLTFQAWLDVETGKTWDVLTVSVVTSAGVVPVWSKTKTNVVMGAWQAISIDLSAFAGKTVQLVFSFNSVEGTYNSGLGVVIDSLRVLGYATAKGCSVAADCNDAIACTDDVCTAGACTWTVADACCVNAADCFDGDACTIDVCQSDNTCGNIPVAEPDCCNTDADCFDNNDCTSDTCQGFNNRCEKKVLVGTPGCCTTKAQCNDNDKCTNDSCVNNMCLNENTCCKSDAECPNSDPACTDVSCVGGACKKTYKAIPGCCTPLLFDESFEAGIGSWTVTGDANCKWQVVSNGQSKSAPSALWYGNAATKNYDCGLTTGSAVSPPIDVPDKPGLSLEFDMWFSIEGGSYDMVFMQVKDASGGASSNLWQKNGGEAQMSWFHQKIGLNAWQGKTIQLIVYFDTIDSVLNTTEGVYVDNVQITDPCN